MAGHVGGKDLCPKKSMMNKTEGKGVSEKRDDVDPSKIAEAI